jgi:hypothetical protein
MDTSTPLTGGSIVATRILAGVLALASVLHAASYVLVDLQSLLIDRHTGLGGIGIYVSTSDAPITEHGILQALAVIDYLAPMGIYIGMLMICDALSKGQVFAGPTLRGVKVFAWSVLLVAIQQIVFNTLVSLTSAGFAVTGEMVFMISNTQLLFLFLGVFLILLSRMFSQALHLAHENESFV